MRIALISGIGPSKPDKLEVNMSIRGFLAYACLGDTWHVSPEAFDGNYDVAIIIITSNPERQAKMVEIAREFKGIKLVIGSDPALDWPFWFPTLSLNAIEIFRLCDGVMNHHRLQEPILRSVTSKPIEYVPEPSWLASNKIPPDEGSREFILLPRTHCSGYNSFRNTLTNYLILKGIQERTGAKAIVCGSIRCSAGELKADEYDLIKRLGIDAAIVNPQNRGEMFELYKRVMLLINMDCTFCVGHWLIDAAAAGIPAICTPIPDAAQCYPATQVHPFDVEKAIELGVRLIEDADFREEVIQTAWNRVDLYSFEEVRRRWRRLVDEATKRGEADG